MNSGATRRIKIMIMIVIKKRAAGAAAKSPPRNGFG
jgi:hypothetical protein